MIPFNGRLETGLQGLGNPFPLNHRNQDHILYSDRWARGSGGDAGSPSKFPHAAGHSRRLNARIGCTRFRVIGRLVAVCHATLPWFWYTRGAFAR